MNKRIRYNSDNTVTIPVYLFEALCKTASPYVKFRLSEMKKSDAFSNRTIPVPIKRDIVNRSVEEEEDEKMETVDDFQLKYRVVEPHPEEDSDSDDDMELSDSESEEEELLPGVETGGLIIQEDDDLDSDSDDDMDLSDDDDESDSDDEEKEEPVGILGGIRSFDETTVEPKATGVLGGDRTYDLASTGSKSSGILGGQQAMPNYAYTVQKPSQNGILGGQQAMTNYAYTVQKPSQNGILGGQDNASINLLNTIADSSALNNIDVSTHNQSISSFFASF